MSRPRLPLDCTPFGLTALYAICAGLWIMFSDGLVARWFSDPIELALASTVKGWLFVVVTALLLMMVLTRRAQPATPLATPPAAGLDSGPRRRGRPWRLIGAFLLVSLTLSGAVGLAFFYLAQSLRQHEVQHLSAVAELKKGEIERWLEERRNLLKVAAQRPAFVDALHRESARGLASPDPEPIGQLELLRSATDVTGAALLTPELRRVAGAGEPLESGPAFQAAATEALARTTPVLLDLQPQASGSGIRLGLIVAVRDLRLPGEPVLGLLAVAIDPVQFLFPLVQSWPVASDTAESLIVRRDGDQVLFLNRLRHQADTALNLRLPLNRDELPAVWVLTHGPGVHQGADYRGVPVLSAGRVIAGTPWALVAKVDQVEVFATVVKLGSLVMALLLGGIGLVGILLLQAWRQERLADQLQLERQVDAIVSVVPGALYSFRQRPDGRTELPFASARFQELLGLDPAALVDDASAIRRLVLAQDLERYDRAGRDSARTLGLWQVEWRINHPWRGLRWLEGVSLPLREADGSTLWRGFIHDVTERHQADERERRFGVTLKSVGDGVIATDEQGRVDFMNPVAEALTGWSLEQARGRPLSDCFVIVNEDSRQPVPDPVTLVLSHGLVVGLANHTILIARDGSERPIADSGAPIRDEQGAITGVVLVFRDQSEQREAEKALRQSENFLVRTVATLTEGVMVFAPDGRVMAANPAAQRITGLSENELKTLPGDLTIWRSRHEDGTPFAVDELPLARALATGEPQLAVSMGLPRPEGGLWWLLVNASPVVDGDSGALVSVVVSFTDLSERRHLEQAAREREELLATIFAHAPLGIVLIDTETLAFTEFNDAAAAGLGYDRDEFARLTLYDLQDSMSAEAARARMAQILERGSLNFEHSHRCRDGSLRQVMTFNQVVHRHGRTYLAAIWHDVTERNHFAQTLATERSRLRTLIDTIPDLVWVKDPNGIFLACNPAFERLYGAQEDAILGRTDRDFVPAEAADAFREHDRRAMAAGRPMVNEEWVTFAADGQRVLLETIKTPMRNAAGEILGVLGIGRDITAVREAQLALRDSERRRQLALDTIQAGIWEWHLATNVSDWSEELWQLYGLTPGSCQPSYDTWLQTVHADDRERVGDLITLAAAAGQEFETEWRVAVAEGAPTRWLLCRGRPIAGSEGLTESYIGIVLDITARKQTEEALHRSQLILRHAQSMAKVSSWTADLESGLFTSNGDGDGELLPGWRQRQLSAEELFALTLAEDRPRVQAAWRAAREGEAGYDLEYRLAFDGAIHWIHAKAEFSRDHHGRALSAIGMIQDITERKQAEEQIHHLAERISIATKAAGIGIWELIPDSGQEVWTEEMFQLYRLAPESFSPTFEGRLARVHPADQERVRRERAEALALEAGFASECRIIRGDGAVRVIKVDAVIYRDRQGRPLRVLGSAIDITDYRQVLEDLRLAKERAEEASAAKTRFLATMSHELRTPLNAIIGFGDLLLRGNLAPEHKEFVKIISQAGKSLLGVIQDILDLTKIEAGRLAPRQAEFDLAQELEAVIAQFGSEALSRQLQLTLTIDPAVPRQVQGDAGLLRQVLVNLMGNAFKFTTRGGVELLVSPCREAVPRGEPCLQFQVRDSGIGIRPENQGRIFEMFEQEDETMTRRFGGSGLGLTISRKLVEVLGGRIWLMSEPGVGSSFFFTARLAPVAAPAPVAEPEPLPPAAAGQQQPLILVVEDDLFSRTLMVRVLEQHGYRVTTASNGAEALEALEHQPVSLVLMDIQLPVMNGAEVTARLRAGTVPHGRPDLPVVALTAYALPGDRERFLSLGMDDYLQKPVDINAVLAVLRKFVG